MTTPYDGAFFASQSDGAQASAAVVVPLVKRLLSPNSVLDVGCGTGTWVARWIAEGVSDAVGVDGDYVDRSSLRIPGARFLAADLEEPLRLGRTFDLVQSLEVAEHLDEIHADAFVASLARHGDTVLFSAALPGQGGAHHVNEQWPSYWIEKFRALDFEVFDVLRPVIWDDRRIVYWYRQNLLLFSRHPLPSSPSGRTGVDVVHPELWAWKLDPPPTGLRELLRSLPEATRASLRWRFGKRPAP